jgi:hypothetical protein
MRFLSLRAVFLLGFVVAMPVLALPPVARRIDALLYGPPPIDFGRPPIAAPPLEELTQPKVTGPIAPALFDEPSPAVATVAVATLQQSTSPPPLPPTPQFAPPSPPPANAAPPTPETRIDERTIARLQQIRQRLEELGADYVIVETQNGGRFRFHCRMLLDSQSRFTRPFEASSFDPIAAGDQVLREVEQWRAAASQPQASLAR